MAENFSSEGKIGFKGRDLMRFLDNEIENMKIIYKEDEDIKSEDIEQIYKLIVKFLCGETNNEQFKNYENLLFKFLNTIKNNKLNYAQFNELLLLLNQDRVSYPFFEFFFKEGETMLNQLKVGIIKFRGFAMLHFGNFRFAYKELIKKNDENFNEYIEKLELYNQSEKDIMDKFMKRPLIALNIQRIDKDKTWFTGELTESVNKELEYIRGEGKSKYTQREYDYLEKKYAEMQSDRDKIEDLAIENTDIYLTWDYMDIYIATSMRHKWEFEETYDFVTNVFQYENLGKLNLRFFDPTQCKCENRIDKGLIEGLMLKRTLCAIYMAQEGDTLGKDSELAATLAQSKPVIAYVPNVDNREEYQNKIKNYPLQFFYERLLVNFNADAINDDKHCLEELKASCPDYQKIINSFSKELKEYHEKQPLWLYNEKEDEFKTAHKATFHDVCKIITIIDYHNYKKRAFILKERHPLAIQVDLESGVANGVLVVRTYEDCAKLLYKILTNSMSFKIEHRMGEKDRWGVTILEEDISKCPYRVVTNYEKLTNSFWNFYKTKNNNFS